MTTKVTVSANHGWPVRVILIGKDGNEMKSVVAPNETKDFYVHSTCDLHIHEIQPGEDDFTVPAD